MYALINNIDYNIKNKWVHIFLSEENVRPQSSPIN